MSEIRKIYLCCLLIILPRVLSKLCFCGEIGKIICWYHFLSAAMMGREARSSEGFVHLTSSGHPTNIGLSWARPAILVAGKSRGGIFLFILFLHFHSCSSFFSSISFLSFSGRRHKMAHKGWHVIKCQHNKKKSATIIVIQLTLFWHNQLPSI